MTKPKLLLVNKFYHDKGPAGGVGRYLVQEEEDLTAAGWEVIPFAMADEHARPSPWDRYFVKARDYSEARYGGSALADAMSLLWNREAARNLDALLGEVKPDVAHLHNIYHHLSPSILAVLKKHRIPVVMTLHDLRLLCPAIHMLREGEVCEKCKGGKLHNAVLGKCVKDSRAASLLAAVETGHQKWRGLYDRGVATFLCPSEFLRQKYIDWGFPSHQMQHLPNFVDLEAWHPELLDQQATRDSYLYFGRISHEKGMRVLLDTQALWEKKHAAGELNQAPLTLRIAGSGPCDGNLKARLALLKLKQVEVLGPLEQPELLAALSRAQLSIIPSKCYENAPMAALESMAVGVPVVGTELGGVPEMIQDGINGAVVSVQDPEAVLNGILRVLSLSNAHAAARNWAEKTASRNEHMSKLINIFESHATGRRS
ncbi:MAG: glycosyltransferase involved in cell wall biosynthesis [Candidatus Krumholzibacteriia bacterium]|jgi:glycosyltransferase involved in cell wall biosynthesis